MSDAPTDDDTTTAAESADPAPRCFVVMPALNEEASIATVLRALRRQVGHATVVVVDDHSDDGTVERARAEGAVVLPLAHHVGAWAATQAGLRYAQEQRADIVITMDADGQHPAEDIPALVEPIVAGQADVAIGTCVSRGSTMRRVAWVMLRRFSGISLRDLTSGFRVYGREAIDLLAGWQASLLAYQDIGVLTLLLSRGLRIVDIETTMERRQSGHSRIFHSWSKVAYYMAYSLLLGVSKRRLRPYRPTSLESPVR